MVAPQSLNGARRQRPRRAAGEAVPLGAAARYAALRRAAWLGRERPSYRLPLASARRTAAALAEAGWVVQALDAHLIVAQLALELGRLGPGRRGGLLRLLRRAG
jgi:hypothetical protein